MTQISNSGPLPVLLFCGDPVERAKWRELLGGFEIEELIDDASLIHACSSASRRVLVVVGAKLPPNFWRLADKPPVIWITPEESAVAADVQIRPTASAEELRAAVELLGSQASLLDEMDQASKRLGEAFIRYGWRGCRPRRSHSELLQLAITDPLTRVYNRRHFEERLAQEFQWVQSSGGWLSLIMVDLDDLKSVNDTFGLPFGDVALTQVAARLQQATRADDLVCRYGGDEFVVIARGCSVSSAALLSERLRLAVAAEPVRADRHEARLTCSLGVASATRHDPPTIVALIRRAVEALAGAKRKGKNAACHWSELSQNQRINF